jgi:hypothetical protein
MIVLLAACSSSGGGDETCDWQRVTECADCPAGEVRHAWVESATGTDLALAPFAGGLAGATCNALVVFDDNLDMTARRPFRTHTPFSHRTDVVAGGDGFFALQRDFGEPVEFEEDAPDPMFTLLALAPDGNERWRSPFGGESPGQLLGGADGYFLVRQGMLFAFDPAGSSLWQRYASGEVIAAGSGVLLTSRPMASTATILTRVDALGGDAWEKWLVGSWIGPEIEAVGFGDDGSVAIAGRFRGPSLDLGQVQLATVGGSSDTMFVALLGPDGATRWAFPFAGVQSYFSHRVVVDGDRVLVGATYDGAGVGLGLPTSLSGDSFIGIFDETGFVRATILGGTGSQSLFEMVDLPGGQVGATISIRAGGVLQIGGTRYEPGGDLTHYFVTLQP